MIIEYNDLWTCNPPDQETPHILQKSKVRCHFQKNVTFTPYPGLLNPLHTLEVFYLTTLSFAECM